MPDFDKSKQAAFFVLELVMAGSTRAKNMGRPWMTAGRARMYGRNLESRVARTSSTFIASRKPQNDIGIWSMIVDSAGEARPLPYVSWQDFGSQINSCPGIQACMAANVFMQQLPFLFAWPLCL